MILTFFWSITKKIPPEKKKSNRSNLGLKGFFLFLYVICKSQTHRLGLECPDMSFFKTELQLSIVPEQAQKTKVCCEIKIGLLLLQTLLTPSSHNLQSLRKLIDALDNTVFRR